MRWDLWTWEGAALSGVAVFLAFLVQGGAGFGAGLVAVPILLWGGLGLPESVAVLIGAGGVQLVAGVWRYRRDLPWRRCGAISAWRLVGLPIGMVLLGWLATHRDLTELTVGTLLLISVALRLAVRVEPRPTVGPGWTAVAGLSSGTLAATVGIGGPPLVLWVTAHDWSPRMMRGAMWLIFLCYLPVMIVTFLMVYGGRAGGAILLGLTVSPLALVGMATGLRLVRAVEAEPFRRMMLGLLVVMGMVTLARGLM